MGREEHCIDKSKCEILMPNGTDICLEKDDCEKKVNIKMKRIKTISISGYVYDYDEEPVENAVVRLFEYEDCDHLKAVCYTFTDCDGFYIFNLRGKFEGKYHIFVSECNDIRKHHCKDACDLDCDDDLSCEDNSKESYSCIGCKRKSCTKRKESEKETNKIDYSNFI